MAFTRCFDLTTAEEAERAIGLLYPIIRCDGYPTRVCGGHECVFHLMFTTKDIQYELKYNSEIEDAAGEQKKTGSHNEKSWRRRGWMCAEQ